MSETSNPPIFLVGAPRSGTSLLYKALCLHPDVSWISNYVRRVPALPELAVFNRGARLAPALRRRVWFGDDGANAYVYGSRRGIGTRLFPMPVEGEPLFRRSGLSTSQRPTGRDAAASLRRAVSGIKRWSGGSFFVNKRIANNQRIPELLSAFPDARFVVITRDGRAVAASLAKVDWWPATTMFWCAETPESWAKAGRDPWELCAREWVEQVQSLEKGLQAVASRQVTRITFESFIASPLPTLLELAGFIGLPPSPEWEAELAGLRFPPRGEGWRSELDPGAVSIIERFQIPLLRELGYG